MKTSFSRRQILSLGLQLAASSFLWRSLAAWSATPIQQPQGKNLLLSPFRSIKGAHTSYGVACLDLTQNSWHSIPTPFAPHKLCVNAAGKIGFSVSSYGNELGKFDLKEKKFSHLSTLPAGLIPTGHCVLSSDEKTLLLTVVRKQNGMGAGGIALLNAETLALQDYILPDALRNTRPHDLELSKNSNEVLLTAGLNFYEFNYLTGKITRAIQVPMSLPDASLSHFASCPNGNRAFQGNVFRYTENGKSVVTAGTLIKIDEHNNVKLADAEPKGNKSSRQDLFGLCFSPDGKSIAVVQPFVGQISFWRAETLELVSTYSTVHPTGLTLSADGSEFIVTSMRGLLHFSSEKFTLRNPERLTFADEFAQLFGSEEPGEQRLYHSTLLKS